LGQKDNNSFFCPPFFCHIHHHYHHGERSGVSRRSFRAKNAADRIYFSIECHWANATPLAVSFSLNDV
jgi:hypothetical protein